MPLTTTLEAPIEPVVGGSVAPNEPCTVRDPCDTTDTDWKTWFPGGVDGVAQGGNEVVGYINGAKLFTDMAAAIRTAKKKTHFVLVAGWSSDMSLKLVANDDATTLPKLLEEAAGHGATIRGLYYQHSGEAFGGAFTNGPIVAAIDSLPTGAAIHDSRHLTFGAHHHKLLIVSGEFGLIAFVGGNDIIADRLAIHDTHVRVRGPAAVGLYNVFRERWAEHPESKGTAAIPSPLPSNDVPNTNHFVQVGRTYPNGSAHAGIEQTAAGAPKGYAFAPKGEREVEAMTVHAIARAKKFIYLEEQYLVSDAISLALEKAIPKLSMLVILLCDTDFVNGELVAKKDTFPISKGDSVAYYYQKRRDFLDRLYVAGPSKVHVFERMPDWMHSKAWVFDDKFAIIGSANVNRRGYTHDSEVQCGIFDVKADKKSRWYWAHELRMNLWAKHLGVTPISCRDPIVSLPFWTATTTASTRTVRAYARNRDNGATYSGLVRDSKAIYRDLAWNKIVDPDGG